MCYRGLRGELAPSFSSPSFLRSSDAFLSSTPPFFGLFSAPQYSRSQNPTRLQLETSLASLENGAGALAFASGSAATAAAVMSLGVNAHILSVNDVYGGTARTSLSLLSLRVGVKS